MDAVVTLTPNDAKRLLANAEPCEVRVQVWGSDFERIGIPLETLKAQPFYRGTEIIDSDNVAHILERGGLERASGTRWLDYHSARGGMRFVEAARRGR